PVSCYQGSCEGAKVKGVVGVTIKMDNGGVEGFIYTGRYIHYLSSGRDGWCYLEIVYIGLFTCTGGDENVPVHGTFKSLVVYGHGPEGVPSMAHGRGCGFKLPVTINTAY